MTNTKLDDYYQQQGSGEPIVFIHGSFANSATWKPLVSTLAGQYHCICINLPGHGGTPDPDDFSAPSIEVELNIIEQVVAKLTNKSIHLVGHSFGGVVALSQALKKSIDIKQLTLFEPVTCWVLEAVNDQVMSDQVRAFMQQYRSDAAKQLADVCGQVIDFWGGAGAYQALPDFIKQSMAPLVKNNLRHWDMGDALTHTLSDLHQLDIPTQVVFGSESNPVASAIAHHLQANIPNCTQTKIEGASHFLVNSHPDDCLLAFNNPL